MILLLAALTAHAQSLDLDGECPGPVDLTVTGITPGAEVAILLGRAGTGRDVIGAGPCFGVETGLAGLALATRVPDADRDGMVRLRPSIPSRHCSTPIQAIDLSTCALSDVDRADAPDGIPCSEQAQNWCFDNGFTDIDFIGDGNLLCTSPATGAGSDCNLCGGGWNTVVWRTGPIVPYGCGEFELEAGRVYGGHSPCHCDGALVSCDTWDMAGCIPD